MESNTPASEIKRKLAYMLKEYVDVSIGEIREAFGVSGTDVSAIEWEGNRIYVALPLPVSGPLNELIRESRASVRAVYGAEDFVLAETSSSAFLFTQPGNSHLKRDGTRTSMKGRYVGLLFRLRPS